MQCSGDCAFGRRTYAALVRLAFELVPLLKIHRCGSVFRLAFAVLPKSNNITLTLILLQAAFLRSRKLDNIAH